MELVMDMFVNLITVSLIAAGACLSALWQMRRNSHAKYLSELQRIQWATDMVVEHGQALDAFMGLPNAPESLKTFVLMASDLVENRDVVRHIAAKIKAGQKPEEGEDTEIWNQAQSLLARDAGAYDMFVRALFSGILAALLRWPETAPVLSRPFAPTQDHIKTEIAITARAVRESASNGWPGNLAAA